MTLLDRFRFLRQPIDSSTTAFEYIHAASNLFFLLAALSVLVGFWGDAGSLIDAAVFGGLGFWLRRTHSVVPAALLLGITALLLGDGVLGQYVGWRSVVLRGLGVVLAIRTVEATIRLARLQAPVRTAKPAPHRGKVAAAKPAAAAAPVAGPGNARQDLESLQQLRETGSDLSKPHTPEFLLGFPTEDAARAAVEKVRALQFEQVEVKQSSHGPDWVVHAEKTLVLTEEALRRLRYHFEKIARAGGGYYEGWGAAIER